MPRAMASTGSRKGQEVREFLRRLRMRTQGLRGSGRPSKLFLRERSFWVLYFSQTAFSTSSLTLLLFLLLRLELDLAVPTGLYSLPFALRRASSSPLLSSLADFCEGRREAVLGSGWREQAGGRSLLRKANCRALSYSLKWGGGSCWLLLLSREGWSACMAVGFNYY